MIDAIQSRLGAGKPLVGIRTASHAFDAQPPDDQHGAWGSFDRDVLGGEYQNHYGSGPTTRVRPVPAAAGHAALTGIPAEGFASLSSLYRSRNLAATTTTLLTGTIIVDGRDVAEPVAWVNTNANRRVFYTSLGGPEDFKEPAFRRLLLNGILWAFDRPVER